MHGLGELEARIMEVFWRDDADKRVRDVLEGLDAEREPAYTTVMTVMDNLYQKGWLGRDRRGRAYWSHSLKSREQTVSDALRAVLADAGDPSGALLHFVRHASDEDSAALAQGLRERD